MHEVTIMKRKRKKTASSLPIYELIYLIPVKISSSLSDRTLFAQSISKSFPAIIYLIKTLLLRRKLEQTSCFGGRN